MKPRTGDASPKIEYHKVSDEDIRPKECAACGGEDIIRRGYQYHDMQDLGTPTTQRILRHEKITWECKHCKMQFMLVRPDVPTDTSYTDDVKTYVFKRVLGKGDAMNRVAADLRELHNVQVTPQAICEWVKAERERQGGQQAEEPVAPQPAPIISLDGTFKAARTKKKAAAPGAASGPFCLHLTRLKDGRLAAYWLPGNERER